MAQAAAKLTSTAAELGGEIDQAFEEIRIPTYVIDREMRVRWTNRAGRELVGDVIGTPFLDLVAPAGRAKALDAFTKKLLGTTRTTDYEVSLRLASGEFVPVEVHSTAFGDGAHVLGVFGALVVPGQPDEKQTIPDDRLTPRQAEVLQALADGCSTAQIATRLGITEDTVRNHVRGLLRALGVHSRLQAVVEARRRGLLV